MFVLEVPAVNETELLKKIDDLKDKLHRAQRQLAGYKEKSKVLEMQYEDSRERDKNNNGLVLELLERQRELNVMLNRANIMLNRTQEAMALTSMEFNEMAKALPEPKKAEWSDRVTKINDLFKKTGIQDAEITGLDDSAPALTDSLATDELRRESEQAFSKKESIWQMTERREPPKVEAVLVDDEPESETQEETRKGVDPVVLDSIIESYEPAQDRSEEQHCEEQEDEEDLLFPPRRKSWWQKLAG